MSILLLVILIVEIINISTYQHFRRLVGGRAKMITARHINDSSRIMHDLCPGVLERAKSAFSFSFSELQGGITLMEYINTGMKARHIAEQIKEDVRKNDYHGVVITLSVGDTIASWLDGCEEDIDVISINPCRDASSLRFLNGLALYLLMFIANIVVFLLGWGGYASILPTDVPGEKKFSLSLLVSLFNNVIFAKDTLFENVWGIILNRRDEILSNKWLLGEYQFLPTTHIVVAEANRHSNTIREAEAYKEALACATTDLY